jgi:nuclease-like protein
MAVDPNRAPGAWVTGQSRRAVLRVWMLLGIFGMALLGGALAAQLGWLSSRQGAGVGFGVSALALLAFMAAEHRSLQAAAWVRGSRAEREVGEELAVLRADGALVFHDVELPRGNIDHVVALPRGAYVVETKARRYAEVHLKSVKRQAHRLHEQVGCWVTPVICLAGRANRPYRREGVWIVGLPHLVRWMESRPGRPIDLERVRAGVQQLGRS